MPTRNVNLPEKLDKFITAKVEAGDYANASEVMRTALRLLEKEEREYEEKMAVLRAAIAEGMASGMPRRVSLSGCMPILTNWLRGRTSDVAKVQCL